MKDRVSLYPGRVKLTPVSGQENTYDMVRADDPTQEGTPLNKATFLKDDTASIFGLGADAVPSDVLNVLTKSVLIKYDTVVLPSSGYWRSVTYGNGKFVTVADNSDKVSYSTDGVTWESATLPYSAAWASVTYGNGKFVTVAYNSDKVAYSTDGVTWSSATLPSVGEWSSVTYGNGKFVAVVTGTGKVAYSADGVTWESANLPSAGYWDYVTYGNGKFVTVDANSNKAAYSSDGITWSHATLPSSAQWFAVTYGNGKFVTVAYNSDKVAYSTDGVTWSSATLPSSARWRSVTYGNGKFVAVAYRSNDAVYSSDGITWSHTTLPSSAQWFSVTYGNGKFVAVTDGSDKVAYSSDGVKWNDAVPALQNVSGDNIYDDIVSVLDVTKIATGSYVGTGTYGSSNPCSITFDFLPKVIFIYGYWGSDSGFMCVFPMLIHAGRYADPVLNQTVNGPITISGNTVSWYTDSYNSAYAQGNASGSKYYWVAIGQRGGQA